MYCTQYSLLISGIILICISYTFASFLGLFNLKRIYCIISVFHHHLLFKPNSVLYTYCYIHTYGANLAVVGVSLRLHLTWYMIYLETRSITKQKTKKENTHSLSNQAAIHHPSTQHQPATVYKFHHKISPQLSPSLGR
ncbi:expressed protein [Phakopsora pachyrhizi]|uniref:Expressed protein n=1 Tax=Phakopsora pachyrhizi TaxID=170000 RepID=A0AAV0ANU6_PHAPC|nr:expressed protein [Phakopsora pachyrhizi]